MKAAAKYGPRLEATDILRFHKATTKIFGSVLRRADLEISATSNNWPSTEKGTKIWFDLRPLGPVELAARGRSDGQTPVIPLPQFDESLYSPIAWMSWHEEWKALGNKAFELIGVSAAFFWGPPRGEKVQIMRAEWDHLPNRGGNAAQPHWHVDATLMLGYSVPSDHPMIATISQTSELVELVPEAKTIEIRELTGLTQDVSVAGMHLGMSGWLHAESTPKCWQSEIKSLKQIEDWLTLMLPYSVEQFWNHHAVSEVIA